MKAIINPDNLTIIEPKTAIASLKKSHQVCPRTA
jgi:hypothetical protein